MTEAVCDNIGRCCFQSGFAYDRTQCAAVLEPALEGLMQVSNPNVDYDAKTGGDCISDVVQASKSCSGFESTACALAFTGTLPEGAPCASSGECLPSPETITNCVDVGSGGKCVREPIRKLGEACDTTCTKREHSTGCSGFTGGAGVCFTNDGLYCDVTCKPLVSLGEPCFTKSCAEGYCENDACAAFKTLGESCTSDEECEPNAYCTSSQACALLKDDGKACSDYWECKSGECDKVCIGGGFVRPSICSGAI